MATKEKNIGKRVFYSIYAGLVVLLLGAIAFGLIKLWGFLKEYELTQHYNVTDVVLAELNSGDYTKIFDGLKVEISEYETEEMLKGQITEKLGGTFTATKSAKYGSEEKPVYMLKCDGENVALLELVKSGTTPKYGLDVFSFSRIYGVTAQKNESAKIVIPSNVTFTINGKDTTGELFTEERFPEAKRFGEHLKGEPTQRTYQIGGLMNKPEVKFFDKDGNAVPVTEENGVYSCALPTRNSELAGKSGDYALDFAKDYSAFIAYDVSFDALRPYLIRGTEFYTNLRTFNAQYYTPHQGYEFRDEKIVDVTQYSDECFAVKLEFDHVVKYYGEEMPYHNAYTVFVAKTDDGLKVLDLILS